MRAWSDDIVIGAGASVPTLGGRSVPYVELDNAGATPAFRAVLDAVEELLPYHASAHRGSGFKSRLTAEAVEDARATIGRFVGADPARDVVLFTADAAQAVDAIVDTVPMSVTERPDGTLDLDLLGRQLADDAGRVALFVVPGASSITGIVHPIHDIAALVHAAGGRILVDAAHVAAHRPIDMLPHADARHLDFVALPAHTMYAPFGSVALVGCRDRVASDVGEPGTHNVVGAVALAAAIRTLDQLGVDRIARHEAALLHQATERLGNVPGLRLHAPPPQHVDRIGIVPFTLDDVDHDLVAAILDHEHGIGVGRAAQRTVRISFGCYNEARDVHRVVSALHRIAAGEVAGRYRSHGQGDWRPQQGRVSSVA